MRSACIALLLIAALASSAYAQRQQSQTNDEMQPAQLPALPAGMSLQQIVLGDSLFHGRGGCFACHGAEGEGLPAAGDAITVGLSYAQPNWQDILRIIATGLPDALTRSPIRMPARGARNDFTDTELRAVAAYVWAISQTRGEPWPGGHASHGNMLPPGATKGTAGLRTGEKR